jgi:hypothetical protein
VWFYGGFVVVVFWLMVVCVFGVGNGYCIECFGLYISPVGIVRYLVDMYLVCCIDICVFMWGWMVGGVWDGGVSICGFSVYGYVLCGRLFL